MRLLVLLILIAAHLAGSAQPPEFCAVRLSAVLPDGSAILSATADLIDESGETVQSRTIKNGRGEFCDFGFGVYSIRVHGQMIDLPVSVHGIRLIYGKTQDVQVTINPSIHAGAYWGGGNACRAYVRVATVRRKPIPAATVTSDHHTQTADSYGRLLLLVPLGKFTTFRFEKAGFQPASLTLSCSDSDERLERTVYLGEDR